MVWLRKKTQHLPTSPRLNPHNQLGRLCVYGRYERALRAPTEENAPVLTAADLEVRTHRSRTRLDLSCAHSRFRDQHSVGHPREARRTVTPSEGKDS